MSFFCFNVKQIWQYSDINTMATPIRFSLRSKFLGLLVTIPLVCLGAFVVMGTSYFSKDKFQYIFNSASRRAEVLASEYYLSYKTFQGAIIPILSYADFEDRKFGAKSERRFREQRNIEHLLLVEIKDGKYNILDHLVNFPREIKTISLEKLDFTKYLTHFDGQSDQIIDYYGRSRFFRFFREVNLANDKKLYLVGLMKLPELHEAFATPGIYMNYIVHQSSLIVNHPKFWRKSQIDQLITDPKFFLPAFQTKSPQGVFEKKKSEESSLVVAYAETNIPGTYAFSVVDRNVVISTIKRFLFKSLLILLMVISAVIVVSFITSYRVTQSLSYLVEMTKKISQGDFKIRSNIKSQDEIQVLAENMEKMSEEVQNLMDSQMEQTRMESELGMVHLVQQNLFPPLSQKVGDFSIECRFSSASEAGGDWFHYSILEKYLIIWIGDATGHGAPAALVTAAAKSASSVIELQLGDKKPSPSHILQSLNRAINATAKKSVMMTFFISVIDTETGEMVFANASHEFPLIIPQKENLKKKDFLPLCDVNGKRLGESPDSTYPEASMTMNPGDTLFLFTDGITDLEDEAGKGYGDGRLLRTLAKLAKGDVKAYELADKLNDSLNEYKGKAALPDDLMYIVCRYEPKQKQSLAS